jgi:mono/diheme cytochrome c family protein
MMAARHGFRVALAGLCGLGGGCIPGVDRGGDEPSADFSPGKGPAPQFGPTITADRPPPPISGGTLRVLAGGRIAVAADPDRDRIFVADLVELTVIATVELEGGAEPGRVVEDADGRVHVALRRGGAVVTLAPRTFEVAGRRAVCPAPRGLAFDRARDQLHVACAGGELVTVAADPTRTEPTRRLELARDLRDVVVLGDRLLVSRFRSAEVLVVSGAGEVQRTPLLPPSRKTERIRKGGDNTTLDMVVATPGTAWRMVPFGRGEVMMLHQLAASEAEVSTEPGGYGGGCAGIVETGLSRLGDGPSRGVAVGTATVAVDVAVSPDQRNVALVAAGNAHLRHLPQVQLVAAEHVTVASGSSFCGSALPGGRPMPPQPFPAGGADAGAAGAEPVPADDEPPPGTFEARALVGQAVAVDFTPKGNVVVQTREPATLQIVTLRERRVVLSNDSRADTGHAIFHANTGAGIACASCHPEGGEDGRVWTFQKIGPRRTQTLHGGILRTAPFHWDGSLKTLANLMKEVFEARMGGPALDAEQNGALARWLDGIPALPAPAPRDKDAAARGRGLFFDATVGCATCHGGELLTDNRTVDVGRGRAFQVPSLRGLAARAPYMHDGCAATIKDRFRGPVTCGGGDKHGVTSKLTDRQLEDLIAFLETL